MVDVLALWHGVFLLPVWSYILLALVLTHITIVSVTLYLHRDQAHCSLQLGAPLRHAFRFWLWLTTGMKTREWVAVHRKHHARCETENDPHSPAIHGIAAVLWSGVALYQQETRNSETLTRYGHGTPDDFLERHLYSRHTLGITLMLILQLLLFGLPGLAIWAIQMLWIPFFAAGVINGLGHWFGYRNFATHDISTNLTNIGILIGGEEMHNNHHAYPFSARFSIRWWEFDIGWMYIRLLRALRLATIRHEAPRLRMCRSKTQIDQETIRALLSSRIMVMGQYARTVLLPALRQEARRTAGNSYRRQLVRLRKLLPTLEHRMTPGEHEQLQRLLVHYPQLQEVMRYQQRLQEIFRARHEGYRLMRERLNQWRLGAEQTGIEALEKFSRQLCYYSLAPERIKL